MILNTSFDIGAMDDQGYLKAVCHDTKLSTKFRTKLMHFLSTKKIHVANSKFSTKFSAKKSH